MNKFKPFLLAIFLCLAGCSTEMLTPDPAQASWTLVQTPGTWAVTNADATVSQAFVSNNTAHNLLIAFVSNGGAGGSFNGSTNVTDTAGNTWKQAGSYAVSLLGIWYVADCNAGANTVTFDPGSSSGITKTKISVAEYSGQLISHPLDFAGGVSASGSQPAGGAYVAQAGALIVNAWSRNNTTATWSSVSGLTLRTPSTTVVEVWGDLQGASAGDNHMSANTGASPDQIGAMAVFLPSTYAKESGFKWVRGASLVDTSSSTQHKHTFPGGNQGGNVILVKIVTANTSATVVTGVADTIGNTYSAVKQQHNTNGLNDMVEVWAANNITDTTNANTVTATVSSGPSATYQVYADEYSGQSLGTLLDASAIQNNSTAMSYSITAAKAGQLLLTIGDHGSGGVSWSNIPGTYTDRFYYNKEYSGGLPNQGTGSFGGSVTIYHADGASASGSNTITLNANSAASSLTVSLNRAAQITGSAGTAGATVSYSGAASGSVTADGSGNYTIPNLNAGSYTITPSKSGYTFSPTNSSQTVSTATDISAVNFTATQFVPALINPIYLSKLLNRRRR